MGCRVDAAVAGLKAFGDRFNEWRSRHIRQVAAQLVEDIKNGAPVDTGELRDSVSFEVLTNSIIPKAIIRVEAEYAAFVEFGTSRQAAQPFIMPAIDDCRSRLIRNIRTEIGGLL